MSNALVKRSSGGSGIVPAVASAVLPGLGQAVNGQSDKAIGVMAVYLVSGLGVIGALPLIGWMAGIIGGATWVYGVGDAYLQGRKKR